MARPIINYDCDGVIRIGDITLRQVADKPELVSMHHLVRGDGGRFSAQALVEVVEQFYEEQF
jgi:hypothetical protein